MKNLLDLAVRSFCALWESTDEVSPATPWSWPHTRSALRASRLGKDLLVEWEVLSEADRDTAQRCLAEFDPIRPEGSVVRFKDPSFVQMFSERVVAKNITVLGDSVADVVGGPRPDSLRALARDCGGTVMHSLLVEDYAWVDITLPRAMLESGMDAAEVSSILSEAVMRGLDEGRLLESRGEARAFTGRLARFSKARRVLGGKVVLDAAASRGGQLSKLGENRLTVSFTPKVVTIENVTPGDILEAPNTPAYNRATKKWIKETNEMGVLDAQNSATAFAEHLERDHLSMMPTVEECQVTVAVRDKTIGGVPDWLIECAKDRGMITVDVAAKVMLHERRKAKPGLLTEEDGSVGPGGSAKASDGGEGERGGVSHEQPDVKGGRTAQSQAEPPQEPQAPTEHVPDSEEGAPGGDVKLADGTIVPEPVMKDAMAKLLQNLATQLQNDTEDGQPTEPEGDDAEEEMSPEEEQADAEAEAEAAQSTQSGAPQPTNAPVPTAISDEKGSGQRGAMAEGSDDLARRIFSGEITVAEALGLDLKMGVDEIDLQHKRAQRSQVQKDEMESVAEGAWVDDLQKIIPHIEAGLKAAGYKKDPDGRWCEKDGADRIKLSPTPGGLLILHDEPLTEELDLGQNEEGQQLLVALADAADAMKAMRSSAFALFTDHLVRIVSMATALGAKPAAAEAEKLRKEIEKHSADYENLAKTLNKIHDKAKAKAGGDASTLQQPAEPEVPEEPLVDQAPEPEPAPPAAAPAEVPAEPAPVAESMSPDQAAQEKLIREAVSRCARTDIPSLVYEGAPYSRVRRSILRECRDLPLTAHQVVEVRNRMRRLEDVNVGRALTVALTEGDVALLKAVSLSEGDAPVRVIQAAAQGCGVSERTLDEAVRQLRSFGELEHRLLASALDEQMVSALAAAE